MKRKSMLMLLFAAMTMGLMSCGKNDDGIGNGLPTFATLYSYIGRTDIDAIKTEFTSSGYHVVMEENDLVAEKEDVDCYDLHISNGKVIGVSYGFEDNKGQTKSLLLSKLEEEKGFRSQSGLMQYSGGYLDRNLHETGFSSKGELISALQNLDLSTVDEGCSSSTYSDVKTRFTFGGNNRFAYGIKKHKNS